MHSWKTKDDNQYVWENIIPQKIDYEEYKLLNPDLYILDDQNEFLESVNMDNYFYKNVWEKNGHSKKVISGTSSVGKLQCHSTSMVEATQSKFTRLETVKPCLI